MKRLLVLSYDLPPVASAESILVSKRLAGLSGWEVDAVCANHETHHVAIDSSLQDYIKRYLKTVVRVSPPEWIQSLPKGRMPTGRLKILGMLPDERVYTNPSMLKHLKSLDILKYDTILSWSNWVSVHLVAAKIKAKYPSVRWVSHFSDPWVDNPYKSFGFFTKYINRRMEKKVFTHSDSILFTSDESIEEVMKNYSLEITKKAVCVPHGFDKTLYPTLTSGGRRDKIVLRHIGAFYGPRQPFVFFDALKLLERDVLQRISVELIGSIQHPDHVREQLGGSLRDVVTIKPSVDYMKSLYLMKEADILFLIDAPAERSIFFPSKLVDYMGAQKPILGIVSEGASKRILNEIGAHTAAIDNPQEIMRKILELIEQHDLKRSKIYPNTEKYETQNIGPLLDLVLSGKMLKY